MWKILVIAASFWYGGKFAMNPHSPLQEVWGLSLGVLATWLLTTLFPASKPLKTLSNRLVFSPPPTQEMWGVKRFFLAIFVLACVVIQDRCLHQQKWLFFVLALGVTALLLFFLEKGSRIFYRSSISEEETNYRIVIFLPERHDLNKADVKREPESQAGQIFDLVFIYPAHYHGV